MKLDKKLGIVMIFAVLALISISAVTAFTIKYPDLAGLKNIVSLKGLINAAVIAAAMYFILPLILGKERTPQTPQGHAAMLIIIIIFSLIIGGSMNYFIWEQGTIKEVLDYFIGDKGILKADRIGIFIGATALFAWFLTFLNVGGAEKGKLGNVNFALALIIGIKLAREGVSANALIGIGQIFAVIIFWQNIYKGIELKPGKPWVWGVISLLITLALVGWVGQILSPCNWGWYGFFGKGGPECGKTIPIGGVVEAVQKGGVEAVPGVLGAISNYIFSSWWIWAFLGIAAFVLGLGTYAAAKEGSFKRMKSDIWKYLWGGIKTAIRKIRIPGLSWLFRRKEWKDQSPENEFPFVFRKLRTELEMYMDYALRWEVYTIKGHCPKLATGRIAGKLEADIKETRDWVEAWRDMDIYKNGPDITKNKNGFFEIKPTIRTWVDDWGKKYDYEDNRTGFNSNELLICKIMNWMKEQFENRDLFKEVSERIGDEKKKITDDTLSNLKADIRRMHDEHQSSWSEYQSSFNKYGSWSLINSLMKSLLNQYLLFGEYEHAYRFANPDTTWFEAPVKENLENKSWVVDVKNATLTTNEVGYLKEGFRGGKTRDYLLHEVNERGVCIEDLNKLDNNGKKVMPDKVRLVRDHYEEYIDLRTGEKRKRLVKGIVNYTFPLEIANWLKEEWTWFMEDVRTGIFHPLSRRAADYARVYGERKFGFKVEREAPPTRGGPAFDREALKNHGDFVYLGRKKYFGIGEDSINKYPEAGPINRYPGISIMGFAAYIDGLARVMEEDQERVDEYLRKFVWPTGLIDKDIFAKMPTKTSGGGGAGGGGP